MCVVCMHVAFVTPMFPRLVITLMFVCQANCPLRFVFVIFLQGTIVQSLVNRFKEFNRVKKERKPAVHKVDPSTGTHPPPLKRCLTNPVVPEGEDETSFERHNKQIKAELKKSRGPSQVVLKNLVDRSYAMRRNDVLANSYGISDIFKKYPFLSEPDQVCVHYLFEGIYYYIHFVTFLVFL